MENAEMNEKTQAYWDACSDEYFGNEDYRITLDEVAKAPERAFPREVWEMVHEAFPDLKGKKVLVPSCGECFEGFAMHLLGADVTASDLSSQQIKNAKRRAEEQGWDITFVQADSMTLEGLPDDTYDLVYTSNGAHVWISDLPMMYGNFRRVLKDGGSYIFFEVHPFNRPFKDGKQVKIIKPYTQLRKSELEYHWRIEDFMGALLHSGFKVDDFKELMPHEDDFTGHMWHYGSYQEREKDKFARYDWRKNPLAALPAWLAVRAVNRRENP
jgi:ubiquinone/menaquinone biosynthesis C-methylase UbiE